MSKDDRSADIESAAGSHPETWVGDYVPDSHGGEYPGEPPAARDEASYAEDPAYAEDPLYDELRPPEPEPIQTRRRIKKVRLGLTLIALLTLGLVSFVFGMFMSVTANLPQLEARQIYDNARPSYLYDDTGALLGVLTQHHTILLTPPDLSRPPGGPLMTEAVISVEDRRFYSENGIDVRGILRAVQNDVFGGGGTQGASTITEQFVKNALAAQNHRTIFEKLREAAIAYRLSHRWSKAKILAEYLNTVYFGNGAYGVESAARTYFGQDINHQGCGVPTRLCVWELKPWEAALLAGIIASPSAYDPVRHPQAALIRRNQVLDDMLGQGYITQAEYRYSISQSLPAPGQVQVPGEQSPPEESGYFLNWAEGQVVDRFGAQQAYRGGLKVWTSLDLRMQQAAGDAIHTYLDSPVGPTAALVAIDNATGQVRAMWGGNDFGRSQFNLATQGLRQPGSAFKVFVLATALSRGISPYSVWPSKFRVFHVPGSGPFPVHNIESTYAGSRSLLDAITYSDNSVFAAVGLSPGIGTDRIAHTARRMGISTPISTNPAMILGGLAQGVTPLDMAHAYETLAHGGDLVTGNTVPASDVAGAPDPPVSIREVDFPTGHGDGWRRMREVPRLERVLPYDVASTESTMLTSVVSRGTATNAQIPGFVAGKTGTTSNYFDAWFVGYNHKYTVAVWVGCPDHPCSMKTLFNGGPVEGGTYPALIWRNFMTQVMAIDASRAGRTQGARPAARSPLPATTGAVTATGATPPAAKGSAGAVTSAGGSSPTALSGTGAGTGSTTNAAPSQPAPASVAPSLIPQASSGSSGSATPPAGGASAP